MIAYKAFTFDLRSPIRGGEAPVWDGTLPYTLPKVPLSLAKTECARGDTGWYATKDPKTTLKISKFWPDGRPIRLFKIQLPKGSQYVERGNKLRAENWEIIEELDVRDTIRALSKDWFSKDLSKEMAEEQIKWYEALGRPEYNEQKVQRGLKAALAKRGLSHWKLKRFGSLEDAWDARASWVAWDARAAWGARAAWVAWTARDAWGAWDARYAWDAKDALTVYYAARKGWIGQDPDFLTVRLRSAYKHGLGIAVPVRPGTLGWSMESREE